MTKPDLQHPDEALVRWVALRRLVSVGASTYCLVCKYPSYIVRLQVSVLRMRSRSPSPTVKGKENVPPSPLDEAGAQVQPLPSPETMPVQQENQASQFPSPNLMSLLAVPGEAEPLLDPAVSIIMHR